jgi:Ni2+-binding GTPase involved in maturation of urease and hydrogenase
VGAVSPEAAVFPVSCRTGDGLGAWIEWLERQIARSRQTRADAAVEGH